MAGCLMLNIFCMSRGIQVKEVSILESMSYLFVPCLAFVMFKEKQSLRQIISIGIIIFGIIVFFL